VYRDGEGMTQTGSARSTLDEVRRLSQSITDVMAGLQNQQALLRAREMTVPPEGLQSVGSFLQGVERLEATLKDMERETRQLQALVANAALMNSSRDIDSVLAGAMDEVLALTGAERSYLVMRDEQTGALDFRVTRELASSQRESESVSGPKVSSTILATVLTTGQPMLTDNALNDPRTANSATVAQFVMRSVMCVPLRYKDRTIGAIYVDNRFRSGVFTERELNLLNAFANQIAIAIENALLFQRVQVTLAEITEMKELIENVFASIGSGVITTTADHHIMTFNNASEAILRRTAPDAIGQPLSAIMPRIEADLDTLLRAVRDTNAATTLETTSEMPDRGRVVLSMKLSPLKDGKRDTQGVAMVLDDLTAEREREETAQVMRRYLPPGMLDNIQHISRLALGGERREVSCLFADVCPLKTFTHHSPAQVMELLNIYLSRATEAVYASNGLIDKYMGSEIMVLFNTQLNPMTDHPGSALTAALELRHALLAVHEALGIDSDPNFYRVGIHSGVATLGNVGSVKRRNFTAIGDTINLAKRLEENAAPGQILVSEDVLSYARSVGTPLGGIRLDERGTIQVKGRRQQTPVYEVHADG
jgi:class 3 adenylate cyclase/GAF domain-containing protein